METIQIKKENVIKVFKSASPELKVLLSDLFGNDVLSQKITDRVKTFEDACEITGEDPNDDKFTMGTPDEIAYKMMKVIIRALNEDWECNWNDSKQKKWYSWFIWNGSGFRFGTAAYDYAVASAAGGSRLRLCSEETARYFGTQFIDLVNKFLQ